MIQKIDAIAAAICVGSVMSACSRPAPEGFFEELQALCGQAFLGRMTEGAAADSAFRNNPLIMHVRQCSDDQIHIPLHVGDDRSRTWVISQRTNGLQLRHDHRHEDGTQEELSQYGGVSADGGSPTRLEFPADMHTATLVPEAAANVWTLEIKPREMFVYALRREGTDRRVRLEFDLSAPTDMPPAPWGTRPSGDPPTDSAASTDDLPTTDSSQLQQGVGDNR